MISRGKATACILIAAAQLACGDPTKACVAEFDKDCGSVKGYDPCIQCVADNIQVLTAAGCDSSDYPILCNSTTPPTPKPTPAPEPTKCMMTCQFDSDCKSDSECGACVPSADGSSYKCMVTCGKNCTADEHCGSSNCGACIGGLCQTPPPPPGQCGTECNNGFQDCDPKSECNLCIPVPNSTKYHCAAGCDKPCTADEHCGSSGCGLCQNGTCRPDRDFSGCGGPCNDGVHVCNPGVDCNLCIPLGDPNTTKVFRCMAGCAAKCTASEHCGSAGCNKCESGHCVVPGDAR
eukprot:TRINITY_DN498_c6_g1_i1.p1 TRINITY_DN498_c6_g1~~TRINITY_DN498_c6_g1_i1.p1  ORF type:complete len:291 (+),score=74.82 TRINITY_DN498_c6_g1_i1:161-1033(+)